MESYRASFNSDKSVSGMKWMKVILRPNMSCSVIKNRSDLKLVRAFSSRYKRGVQSHSVSVVEAGGRGGEGRGGNKGAVAR